MKQKAAVTIGSQTGDEQAGKATEPHREALYKLLSKHCLGPYSPDVDEFSLILRVDGDFWHWEQEGCDRMRRSKKGRYITIDIYVPRQRWEGVSGINIRRYLAACTEEALRKMIGKLQRDKTPVDGAALLRDFASVKEHYLPQIEAVASQ